jgi:hypothetical protein
MHNQNIEEERLHMTFIAIENMASAYGFKDKNTTNKPVREFESRGQENRQRRQKQEIFEHRRELAEAVDFNPKKDPSDPLRGTDVCSKAPRPTVPSKILRFCSFSKTSSISSLALRVLAALTALARIVKEAMT